MIQKKIEKNLVNLTQGTVSRRIKGPLTYNDYKISNLKV